MPGPAGRHSGDRAPAAAQVVAVTALTATGPGPDFTTPVCLEEGRMLFVTFILTYTDLYSAQSWQSFAGCIFCLSARMARKLLS